MDNDFDLIEIDEEKVIKELYDFIKDKFGGDLNETMLRYSIFPLFWESKNLDRKIGVREKVKKLKIEIEVIKAIEEVESNKESQGKEWVDWYNPMKWKIEALELLKKIEQNTRK